MPPDRPTDIPTMVPDKYLSVRLTLAHAVKDSVVEFADNYDEYCIYMHKGGTSNEHYHVCIAGLSGRDSDRVRNRVKRTWKGVKHTIKSHENGVRSFMFYCGHEGSEPIFKGSYWEEVKGTIDKYYEKVPGKIDLHFRPTSDESTTRKERYWQLTYNNLVPQAVIHRARHGLDTEVLKTVVRHMIKTTKWRPSKDMARCGVPKFYQKDFEFRIGVITEPDMDWWEPRSFD